MATLFLIRHGLTAQTGHVLYGRTSGIELDHRGRAQAIRLAARFEPIRLTAIYSSPLERCTGTVAPLAEAQRLPIREREALIEMDAGTWTGKRLSSLRRQKAWATVQRAPSAFRFPGGEGFIEAQARVVAELGSIARRHRRGRVAVATHGDIVRIALAYLSAIPLDEFQRVVIDTSSVSVVAIEGERARILLTNDTGGLDRFGHAPVPPWEAPPDGRSERKLAG
jgi:probable phosphomutase (TIGR03848 family)